MYNIKICPICGDEFIPASPKQKYCKKPIKSWCPICGTEFERVCSADAGLTCSKSECKRKASTLGTKFTSKTCRVCGNVFHPMSSRQLDCNAIVVRRCIVCGNEFEGRCSLNDTTKTCSSKCLNEYQSKMRMQKYADSHEIPCIICGKLFHPVNNTNRVCNEKHLSKCEVCGKEFEITNSSSKVLNERLISTCSRECATVLRFKHRAEFDFTEYYHNKRAQRLLPEQLNNYENLIKNPEEYLSSKYPDGVTIDKLSRDCGMHTTTIGSFINSNNLQSHIQYNQSAMENEVVELIREIDPTADIIRHDRKTIAPYEIDILINNTLGIECNPTSSHNSSVPMFDNDAPTPSNYHKCKTDRCEKAGVFLFHLFGYDWTPEKQPIVESMLRNVLGHNQFKYYARNCIVKEVDSTTAEIFLSRNHRQGNVYSKIRLGLYDRESNNLVSLMTFGNMRNTLGTGATDLSDCYELVRFCNILNTSVVGGASKLFKHFVDNYHPNRVRSFSDRAHTRGALYSKLGFHEVSRSDHGYVWVNQKTDVAYSRVNAQKHNIKKFLQDDSIDLNKTEAEIMIEHGYVQVFDSGTITWEWCHHQ